MKLNTEVQILIVLAAVLLLFAISPVLRITKSLSPGLIRRSWYGVLGLIGIFFAGDLTFLWINATEGENHHEDWLVAFILLLSSAFVLVFSKLSEAAVMDIARLAELEFAASVDIVTELYNRRHIMSLLDGECSRAHKSRSPLSILLVDIDNFKQINDTYGHHAGDLVLREIAQLIARRSPNPRLVGRYGGEEFLVILPAANANEAGEVAEVLRAVVQATAVAYNGDPIITPTVSIGLATTFGWLEKSEQLLAVADEALYAAKAAGKNRVCHGFEPTRRRVMSNFAVIAPPN